MSQSANAKAAAKTATRVENVLIIITVLIAFLVARSSFRWKLEEGAIAMSDYAFQSSYEMRVDSYQQDPDVATGYAETNGLLAFPIYYFLRFMISCWVFILIMYIGIKCAKPLSYKVWFLVYSKK